MPQVTTSDSAHEIPSWIARHVAGRTFADIGGIGVNSGNERITLAVASRASSATMLDIVPRDHHLWATFHEKCRKAGLSEADYKVQDCVDINDPQLREKVGTFEFVHSTGINYHLPNPVHGLHNLRTIVGEYLITNTVIVPDTIETAAGTLNFPGSQAVFMPGLSEAERRIFDAYYRQKFNLGIDYMAPRLDAENPACPWFEHGEPTCWPFWWLMTISAFEGLVRLVGFEILDSHLWQNHAYAVFCRRVDRT